MATKGDSAQQLEKLNERIRQVEQGQKTLLRLITRLKIQVKTLQPPTLAKKRIKENPRLQLKAWAHKYIDEKYRKKWEGKQKGEP
jgi:hypothetical protein